jgi:hypothetical protein
MDTADEGRSRARGELRFAGERDEAKTVWVDRKRIEPAAKWQGQVARAIEASRAVIYVMTPESLASEDCRRELDLAAERNKLIIPILLRDVPDAGRPDLL